jgi:hypothetical protein
MIYEIRRTSVYGGDPDVPGAVQVHGYAVRETGYKSLEELRGSKLKPYKDVADDRWYTQNGTLHFNAPCTYWAMDVADITNLLNLGNPIILSESNKLGVAYCIEIYDDYRE